MSTIQLISIIAFALAILIISLTDYFFFTKSFSLNSARSASSKTGETEVSRGLKDKFAQLADEIAEKCESALKSTDSSVSEGKNRQQEIQESK